MKHKTMSNFEEGEYDQECDLGHWGCMVKEHNSYDHPKLSERDRLIMSQIEQLDLEILHLQRMKDRWMEDLVKVEKPITQEA